MPGGEVAADEARGSGAAPAPAVAIVPGLAGRTDRGVRWPMLVLVALVGVASGLVSAGFVAALRALTDVLGPEHWSDTTHLFVLGGVGAAIALITLLLGNPGDVELLVDNIHVSGGRSDIRDLRSLIPVSLLGIAAGSPIGPEAPLVQTTGSIGSWVGLRLRLHEDELRLLTISGMAAGFTVLLGVPLGSAVFALEILHRRGLEYYEALLPALVGALSGYGVYVAITGLGLDPALRLPAPASVELGDLALAVGPRRGRRGGGGDLHVRDPGPALAVATRARRRPADRRWPRPRRPRLRLALRLDVR